MRVALLSSIRRSSADAGGPVAVCNVQKIDPATVAQAHTFSMSAPVTMRRSRAGRLARSRPRVIWAGLAPRFCEAAHTRRKIPRGIEGRGLPASGRVAYRHAGTDILLDAVLREWVAQAVLG